MVVYWLDADVFIQQANPITGAYPPDRAPQFWKFLSAQIEEGIVRSPKIVFNEVTKGHDWLADWFKNRREKGLCVPADKAVHGHYTKIADYVVQKYGDRKAREFLRGGDLWVIAHAMSMGEDGIVVTGENTKHSEAKVKVPTVCSKFDVGCLTIYQMCAELSFRFVDWS